MGTYFSFSRFLERFGQIFPYLKVTLNMVLVSMFFGTILGIIVAALRIKKIPVLHQILSVYISFMRGTPLLVQICVANYGIPLLCGRLFMELFGINLNRVDVLIFTNLAFVLNEGAFLSEIFRSAILSVPSVQTEAGYTIGMTELQTFTKIVLPQAVNIAIPPYGVDLLSLFHNTSIAFTLGVVDMMGRAKTLGVATGHTLEGFVVVAIFYIVISLIIKVIFVIAERRMK